MTTWTAFESSMPVEFLEPLVDQFSELAAVQPGEQLAPEDLGILRKTAMGLLNSITAAEVAFSRPLKTLDDCAAIRMAAPELSVPMGIRVAEDAYRRDWEGQLLQLRALRERLLRAWTGIERYAACNTVTPS